MVILRCGAADCAGRALLEFCKDPANGDVRTCRVHPRRTVAVSRGFAAHPGRRTGGVLRCVPGNLQGPRCKRRSAAFRTVNPQASGLRGLALSAATVRVGLELSVAAPGPGTAQTNGMAERFSGHISHVLNSHLSVWGMIWSKR